MVLKCWTGTRNDGTRYPICAQMKMKQNEDIVKPKDNALEWFGQQPALAAFKDDDIRQIIMGEKEKSINKLRQDWEDFVNKTEIEDIMSRKKFISIINEVAEREDVKYRIPQNTTIKNANYIVFVNYDDNLYGILGDGGIAESNQEIYPDIDAYNELTQYFQEAFEAEKKGEKYFLEFEDSDIISKLKKRFKTLKALEKEMNAVGKQMGLASTWNVVKAGWGVVENILEKAISRKENKKKLKDDSHKILYAIWESDTEISTKPKEKVDEEKDIISKLKKKYKTKGDFGNALNEKGKEFGFLGGKQSWKFVTKSRSWNEYARRVITALNKEETKLKELDKIILNIYESL